MHIRPRVGRVLQHAHDAGVGETAPAQLAGPRAAVGAQREPAAGEHRDHAVGRTGRGEAGEHVPIAAWTSASGSITISPASSWT